MQNTNNKKQTTNTNMFKTTKNKTSNSPGMLHLTIDTGHCVTQRASRLMQDSYEALQPLLKNSSSYIPGLPGMSVEWTAAGGCYTIRIFKNRTPVIVGVLDTGTLMGLANWNICRQCVTHLNPLAPSTPALQAPTPWLAVRLLPPFVLLSRLEQMLLGSFEADFGLAILRYTQDVAKSNPPTHSKN